MKIRSFKIFVNQNNNQTQYSEILISTAEKLIAIINLNNPSTLIGSISSTEELQKLIFNIVPCSYDKQKPDVDKYDDYDIFGYSDYTKKENDGKNGLLMEKINNILNNINLNITDDELKK